MRKLLLVPVIACLVSCIFYIEGGWGAEFCVNNATDLQSALTIAASNSADDTIKVVQGTYTGNFTYTSGGEPQYHFTGWLHCSLCDQSEQPCKHNT